jgi:hypothetical protein
MTQPNEENANQESGNSLNNPAFTGENKTQREEDKKDTETPAQHGCDEKYHHPEIAIRCCQKNEKRWQLNLSNSLMAFYTLINLGVLIATYFIWETGNKTFQEVKNEFGIVNDPKLILGGVHITANIDSLNMDTLYNRWLALTYDFSITGIMRFA